MAFVFLWRNLPLSFSVIPNVFPERSLTLYGRPLSVVHEVCFLGVIFDERLTWVPHLKVPLTFFVIPYYLGG